MLNVIDITSRLAKMSDPQLRQYAQIHKDDPYTLALAAAENKRRAQLRASGQQQAPQPTVADQVISQMGAPAPQMQQPQQMQQQQPQLPEQQGIGMLPAENVAGMADGGIAGYDDQFVDSYADAYAGGGIVAFAGNDSSLVRKPMTAEEQAELDRYRQENFDRLYGLKDWASGIKKDIVDWFNADRSNIPFESKSPAIKYGTPKYTGIMEYERPDVSLARERQERGLAQTPAPEQFQAPAPVEKEAGWAVKGKKKGEKSSYPAPIDEGNVYTGRDTYKYTPFDLTTDAGKKAAAKRPGAGTTKDQQAGAVPASDFVPSKPGDLAVELKRLQAMSPGTKAYDDLSAKIKQGYADLEKAKEESKPKDKAYAGLEALLGKEEEKAKSKEAKNFNMAIINSGLAVAAGESQHALQNIAKGLQVGTKQYQEGLEKLEAAALERRKQNAMIEEARRAEARGDWKEAQQFKQKAFEADLGVKQAQIAAVQDLYKTDLKTATDIVNNQNTLASADQRALMQQQHEDIRARERNITDLQGRRIMASAYGARADQRGAITPALILKEYNDRVAADPRFKKQYPEYKDYEKAILGRPTLSGDFKFLGFE